MCVCVCVCVCVCACRVLCVVCIALRVYCARFVLCVLFVCLFVFAVPLLSPSNVTVSVCAKMDDCLLVSWETPTNDSYKHRFKGYVIYYHTANDHKILTEWINKETTSHELTGLILGATYYVQVAIVNHFGPGLPSDLATSHIKGQGKLSIIFKILQVKVILAVMK